MKKLLVAITIGVAALAYADDMYVYSRDGVTKGSGERMLPSQGVKLSGESNTPTFLYGVSDAEKAECGWYKVVPFTGNLESNQYFSCTGYVFNAQNGTATRIGKINTRKNRVRITKYSKLKVYTAACQLGKWEALNQWMTDTTIQGVNIKTAWDNATYLTDKYPLFTAVVQAGKAACNMTDEELATFLKSCEDGYEYETVD